MHGKIGSVAFNSIGNEIVSYASEKGFEIFLDLCTTYQILSKNLFKD